MRAGQEPEHVGCTDDNCTEEHGHGHSHGYGERSLYAARAGGRTTTQKKAKSALRDSGRAWLLAAVVGFPVLLAGAGACRGATDTVKARL